MNKHTIGPWFIQKRDTFEDVDWHVVVFMDEYLICSYNEVAKDELPDAELIAESPNLLAALKGIINATDSVAYGKAYEEARELVAKIEVDK